MNDITVQELKQKIDAGDDFVLIDVREPFEYEMYNIGAKLIPLANLTSALASLEAFKDKEIVVHCRSGMRSATAKEVLVANGFLKTRNLLGGMLAWQDAFEKI